MAPLLLVLTIVSFLILSALPGSAASALLGENASPEAKAQAEKSLGLDKPVQVRYVNWLRDAVQGDFGRSYINRQPIRTQLQDRLPVTIELGVIALIFATIFGLSLGILASLRPRSIFDRFTMVIAVGGVALPNFFLAMLLVLLFSVKLHWLPATGWIAFSDDPLSHVRHLVLPIIALLLAPTAVIARMTRTSMISVLSEDYVRTARAKGLRHFTVVTRHALRNALIPTLTILGLQLGSLLGGAIIVESVFGLPGMGRLALSAVTSKDIPTIQAVVVIVGAGVLCANLLVDVLYAYVNPRIRYA
ncbi:hypothetical protein AYO38_00545 [bacterium SCGC AG-212-C10]|nr:hypothetical protein AYO38_00545 [bacterium SCGC AG-212-C10]